MKAHSEPHFENENMVLEKWKAIDIFFTFVWIIISEQLLGRLWYMVRFGFAALKQTSHRLTVV